MENPGHISPQQKINSLFWFADTTTNAGHLETQPELSKRDAKGCTGGGSLWSAATRRRFGSLSQYHGVERDYQSGAKSPHSIKLGWSPCCMKKGGTLRRHFANG
jgi:hypothetical protein